MSVGYRSTCRPTFGIYIDRDVSVNMSTDISVEISADMSIDMLTVTSRSTHRPRVGRYVDRHIGRASTYRSRGAQTTHDQTFVKLRPHENGNLGKII